MILIIIFRYVSMWHAGKLLAFTLIKNNSVSRRSILLWVSRKAVKNYVKMFFIQLIWKLGLVHERNKFLSFNAIHWFKNIKMCIKRLLTDFTMKIFFRNNHIRTVLHTHDQSQEWNSKLILKLIKNFCCFPI